MKNNLTSALPKAELHLHIEGTLEPDLLLKLANRHRITLPFTDISEVKAAYQFTNLQSFLDLYYQAAQVLITEEDFYDLTLAYFDKVKDQNVRHVELFFDPQTHLDRKVTFETVLNGIDAACQYANKHYNISTHIIACFLRDKSITSAQNVFKMICRHQNKIIGIGLDSAEVNHPPSKFADIFSQAKARGFRRVAHAGEEGPPDYIWQAIKLLDVERIDHGIRCIEDTQLLQYLAEKQLPLTVCPLSNVKLQVVSSLDKHPLKRLLDHKLRVTINSDDPAYFGGYIDTNYEQTTQALGLTETELLTLAKNSFLASFLTEQERKHYLSLFPLTTSLESENL